MAPYHFTDLIGIRMNPPHVLDVPRPNINRALMGRSGEVPKLWQNILETLDLELTAVPRAQKG